MKLTELLTGGQIKNTGTQASATQTAQNSTAAANIGRQIQALTPGQTLQGEVVARDGNQVQIKVADDFVLEARVDQDMSLEVGKNMTFEVRNNGQTLTLSPLFANTANQTNALKALEMAALPINQSTVTMTGMMMEAGLSIDRNSLQQMFREVNTFPDANISDVVDLHKLGLSVNEENLTQLGAYKNLTHQLVEGMHTVLGTLPDTVESMVLNGDTQKASQMVQDLLQMIQELPDEAVEEGMGQEAGELAEILQNTDGQGTGEPTEILPNPDEQGGKQQAEALPQTAAQAQAPPQSGEPTQGVLPESIRANVLQELEPQGEVMQPAQKDGQVQPESLQMPSQQDGSYFAEELMEMVQSTSGQEGVYGGLVQQLAEAIQQGSTAEQAKALQQLLEQGRQDQNQPLLEGILTHSKTQEILSEGLSKLWTITPRDVADSGKVEELYARLDRQLKSLTQTLEQNGQTQSQTFKAANNMTQNLDFLQQINQAYTYVQLPLRLQQGDAHGDLYVYTNKRSLAAKDGQISALLHLDMEHLGPVDVYVAMQAEHVNTKFYVQDDEILDFLEEHMDMLTDRLQKRGYDCNFAMQVRQDKTQTESGLKGLLAQEQPAQPIARYAFDVRA